MTSLLKPTPWDTSAFDMPTWELTECSENAMKEAAKTAGHHTLKVNPLINKRLMHDYGFYYCDTLIEPHCNASRLRSTQHPNAHISKKIDIDQVMAICHGAFSHGRFHRDFNLPATVANLRYDNWLKQLINKQMVYGLYWENTLAGFIGYTDNSLVLHALAAKHRGMGLSKYWWSSVCLALLAKNYQEIKSSVSASNVAAINLYTSLGFTFKNPLDIYHRITN